MNLYEGIAQFLDNTHRAYRRTDGGFAVSATIDGVPAEFALILGNDDVLTVEATLPAETLPKFSEEVIGAVNTANAFANFGGFALLPANNTVRFRSYVRLRGDVPGELRYMLESTDKAMVKFAPALIAVCEGRMTAAQYADAWSQKLKEQSAL